MADAAVSPLARAIRLGREIRRRRERDGISQLDLARSARLARTVLSRIESPIGEPQRRADPRHIRAALVALMGDGDEYRELEPLIWNATQGGWWDRRRGMGGPQQLVAAIECGAERIREYQIALVPGLAQTREYARYRAEATPMTANVDEVVEGRLCRQQQITEAGTRYELILDETALRRLAVPADVMTAQLDHLIALAERPNVSIRVLPLEAPLPAGWAPTSPYSIYEYPDRRDPTIVLIDVVGRLLPPLAEPAEVRPYVQLHDQLVVAALSEVDSVACVKDAAARLSGR